MKLFWKLYLLWHGYCPKHFIEKDAAICCGMEEVSLYCPVCEMERKALTDKRIEKAISVLKP